jgi:hypothetical protein
VTAADQPVDRGIEHLHRDWTYRPSAPTWRLELSRAIRRTALRRPAPRSRVIVAAQAAARWSCYFAFLPDGRLGEAHRYTLDRLAKEPGKLLVVCATPSADDIPAEIRDRADALIWKGLRGYDFSAYGLMLRHLVERSPGADVFVMNDSVFGPFASPAELLADAPWDLAAFTASSLFENHVQSYAFQLRGLSQACVAALAPVLRISFDRYMDVVICQETRLARTAARAMSVGAQWYAHHEDILNLSLDRGPALAARGVPFLKRSLLGNYAEREDRAAVLAVLEAAAHPIEAASR